MDDAIVGSSDEEDDDYTAGDAQDEDEQLTFEDGYELDAEEYASVQEVQPLRHAYSDPN
jgi:hypothetical protein